MTTAVEEIWPGHDSQLLTWMLPRPACPPRPYFDSPGPASVGSPGSPVDLRWIPGVQPGSGWNLGASPNIKGRAAGGM